MKPAWVDDDDKFPNNGELLETPFIVRNVEADLDELSYRTRKVCVGSANPLEFFRLKYAFHFR